ncbi:flagellar hook protein FlgE [Providencia hangzhouensis]|mgnify:CR=1 FL=1|uniref:Flagellar hook protein FlgE n=1 Tax=Providencia rettgeri TaxID=587 RepID=A0AAW6UCS4_PRORE|nr:MULTISPECIES: flagellar hook protein FlgE [Providencia]MBG5891690.1 flagellar hook protein FlgE [Providencia rettgeri]MCG9526698.1 flagellar hook protein FlgE [Providencia rettgeri]MDI9092777.1 flagellar hook protein FlgE [Providencia rettgeri]MDT2034550.1 flagellar hook protein FlgE [Providencia rettgeri]BBV05019.1 flagellar hook protein FlgE [Providencia rettgeri]
MSFSQAVSGLNAASAGLDSIGNNIANSATNGFKGATTSFADMFAGSGVGLGVNVAAVTQNFKDGPITRTDRATDVAISGNGFFRVQDQNGDTYYSRDGQFLRDKSGNLVNNQGMVVTGYPASVDEKGNVTIQSGGVPEGLNIPTDMMDAKASELAKLTINLNSEDKIKDKPFDVNNPDDSATYNFSTTMTAYDSQGNTHEISVYFVKSADNEWKVYAKDANDKVATQLINTEDVDDTVVVHNKLIFDGNGRLSAPTDATFDFNYKGLNGANDGVLRVDLNKTRQQKVSESSVSAIDVNGYPAGEYTTFKIEDNGLITANYSNQQKRVVGQVALSAFANPNGLVSQGGNVWASSNTSGNPMDGVPGVGQFGKLTSGALESSNVDMSQELISMIVMQRNYQSNAQTIKTQDQMLQTLVNLR